MHLEILLEYGQCLIEKNNLKTPLHCFLCSFVVNIALFIKIFYLPHYLLYTALSKQGYTQRGLYYDTAGTCIVCG